MSAAGGAGPAASGAVVVVGAINVDFVVSVDRLPAAGETVVGPGMQRFGGGKGANAAVAAARAGANVRLVGAVGDDDTGAGALDELRAEGVGVDEVAVLPGVPTGVALIVVDTEGENQIAVGAGANDRVDPDAVREALCDVIPGAGCVLVSTEIPDTAVAAAVEEAVRAGVCCVLNPAPVTPGILRVLDRGAVLTPNRSELADLLRHGAGGGGDPGPDTGVEDRARRVARTCGAPVIVTLGGDGVVVVDPVGTVERVAAGRATVRDTTGAGDTFNGVLAARLAAGDGLSAAVRTAVVAASLSVAQVGARGGMPSADVIEAARPHR